MSKPRLPGSGGTRLRLLGNNQAHLYTLGTLHSQFTSKRSWQVGRMGLVFHFTPKEIDYPKTCQVRDTAGQPSQI